MNLGKTKGVKDPFILSFFHTRGKTRFEAAYEAAFEMAWP